tara:strand:- start:210 stop:2330 length:2121 start_codon:yes stop_codon:yes gene_type:complete
MGLKKLLTNLSGVIDKINEDEVHGEYPHHDLFNPPGNGKDGFSIFDNPYNDKLFNFRQKSLDFDTYLENPEWVPLINRVGGMFGNATETHTPLDEGVNARHIGNTPDSQIRGGLTTFNNRRFLDKARFDKWLQTPAGRNWNSTQTLLQASNPKPTMPVEGLANTTSFKQAFQNLTNVNPNQTTWNLGLNTGQSILSGGKRQIPRAGLTPFKAFHDGYADYIPTIEDNKMNRLVHLAEKTGIHIVEKEEKRGAKALEFLKDISKRANNVVSTLSGRGEELYSYLGGPGSKFGFGRTFIGRYTNTIEDKWGKDHPYSDKSRNYTWSDRDVREISYGLGNPGIKINPDNLNGNISTEGYDAGGHIRAKNPNFEDRFTYNVYNSKKVDKINMLDIFTRDHTSVDNEDIPKDFIKFYIEVVNPKDPLKSTYIVFRAFLDSLSDDYSAEHNTFNYNGRAEPFYTYKSFNRSISLSFKIAAQSRHEMMPLYKKLNYLVAQTTPTYGDTSRMMTPYHKITVGDLIAKQPGIINSVNLSWQTNYPWEIRLDDKPGGDDYGMLQLPHVLDVSMKFTPIHNFIPENSTYNNYILPFETENLAENQKWYKTKISKTPSDAQKPFGDRQAESLRDKSFYGSKMDEDAVLFSDQLPFGTGENPWPTPIPSDNPEETTRRDLVGDKLKSLVSDGSTPIPDSAFIKSSRKRKPLFTEIQDDA